MRKVLLSIDLFFVVFSLLVTRYQVILWLCYQISDCFLYQICYESVTLFKQFVSFVSYTDCGMLAVPANGNVTYSNNGATTYLEIAVFTCNPGYDLSGIAYRTCEANGKWRGSSPTCSLKGCLYDNYGNE